jgi:hypothetical protein
MTNPAQMIKPESASSGIRRIDASPLTERNLTDRLSGKKVLAVFDDRDFDSVSPMLHDMNKGGFLPCPLKAANWSCLLDILPTLNADVILISSLAPSVLQEDLGAFEKGMERFRAANPRAAVVMVNLYSVSSVPGALLMDLKQRNLVDSVVSGPVSILPLIRDGADVLESRA